jgi:class 3 adenylate cyclase
MKDKKVAANVFQIFLSTMSRVIKSESGEIRSFDGDRVMAVFIGDSRFDAAVRCGLKMNWAFINVVKQKLEGAYPKSLEGFTLGYTAGIDAGQIWAVRGGVRNDNDLVWVGRAPNLGAKLSGLRDDPFRTYITGTVYDKLGADTRLGGTPRRSTWEERSWTAQGAMRIFRSNWGWEIS